MVNRFIKLVMWFFLKAYSGLKFAHYPFTKFVTPILKICSFWRLTFQERNFKPSGISWKIHMARFLTSFVDPILQGVFAMKDSNWYQFCCNDHLEVSHAQMFQISNISVKKMFLLNFWGEFKKLLKKINNI